MIPEPTWMARAKPSRTCVCRPRRCPGGPPRPWPDSGCDPCRRRSRAGPRGPSCRPAWARSRPRSVRRTRSVASGRGAEEIPWSASSIRRVSASLPRKSAAMTFRSVEITDPECTLNVICPPRSITAFCSCSRLSVVTDSIWPLWVGTATMRFSDIFGGDSLWRTSRLCGRERPCASEETQAIIRRWRRGGHLRRQRREALAAARGGDRPGGAGDRRNLPAADADGHLPDPRRRLLREIVAEAGAW